jgi:hypothetical protein
MLFGSQRAPINLTVGAHSPKRDESYSTGFTSGTRTGVQFSLTSEPGWLQGNAVTMAVLATRDGNRNLRAGVPTSRIVELTGANLYMFLPNEADVIREVPAFAATLQDGSAR